MMNALESSSTRPYLIRALYEWCTDNALTPYIAVLADDTVQVPREYVQNGEIVLNISFDATSGLKLGNEFVEFKARFGGVPRDIMVPMDRVIAIYARENGQGMAFPVPVPQVADDGVADDADAPAHPDAPPVVEAAPRGGMQLVPSADSDDDQPTDPPPPPQRQRPALKRIK
ncbi:ClpXP protease specificity-enhancing factor [Ottowia sp.]|uniref:ClpXP protease specificity-enhancing factor n=1 Tax=Ottowia sp. TaxID=1898956 RepID=UPI002C346072|nr:ClpXP protease specificity-enhancing factor [Ottowia sp.]HOB66411.1 ClpXP protease specificity-enhancing factor [Ottowia sp.]HPZ57824.1 ClpXP protease specificity-enhancing factor [Ottowia sp.]HQD49270.1 ClpXP protease specificity-enhancing factor [Ottowia sp.]